MDRVYIVETVSCASISELQPTSLWMSFVQEIFRLWICRKIRKMEGNYDTNTFVEFFAVAGNLSTSNRNVALNSD